MDHFFSTFRRPLFPILKGPVFILYVDATFSISGRDQFFYLYGGRFFSCFGTTFSIGYRGRSSGWMWINHVLPLPGYKLPYLPEPASRLVFIRKKLAGTFFSTWSLAYIYPCNTAAVWFVNIRVCRPLFYLENHFCQIAMAGC